MVVLETIGVAFAMFSAVPVPRIDWNERNMRYAMVAFPLIGAVIGALWCICGALPLPDMLRAAGFCLIPVAVTAGFIWMATRTRRTRFQATATARKSLISSRIRIAARSR